VLFSVETKVKIRKNFLLGLKKELRCNLPPEMESRIAKNVIFKTLNKIKDVA
jgi:hypothetical protein